MSVLNEMSKQDLEDVLADFSEDLRILKLRLAARPSIKNRNAVKEQKSLVEKVKSAISNRAS